MVVTLVRRRGRADSSSRLALALPAGAAALGRLSTIKPTPAPFSPVPIWMTGPLVRAASAYFRARSKLARARCWGASSRGAISLPMPCREEMAAVGLLLAYAHQRLLHFVSRRTLLLKLGVGGGHGGLLGLDLRLGGGGDGGRGLGGGSRLGSDRGLGD